jgi:hypothetical protein
MSTSEQLERETEEERTRISDTLDELRARMTPGHVVDRLVDYATDSSGGMFFRNLRQQAVDNPVPVALVGAGIAWLALAGRGHDPANGAKSSNFASAADKLGAAKENVADRIHEAAGSASDTASKWSDQARSAAAGLGPRGQATASGLNDAARETAGSVVDRVSSAYAGASEFAGDSTSRVQGAARSAADSAADAASNTYAAATEQARRAGEKFQQSASDIGGKVSAGGRSILDFFYEQPLVLVGLGLAIGAAVGAASSSTEAEDELMGERSDALKEDAATLAQDQLEKGQAVAGRAWESATDEAERQGLVASSEGTGASRTGSGTNDTATLVPSTETRREDETSER